MASEVKCPFNADVRLLATDEQDSTFNIVTPFSFSRIDDYSYAVSERLTTAKELETKDHYDSNGNFLYSETLKDNNGEPKYTGRTILSATGYDYRFPHKPELGSFDTVQENSVGWFNSWGSPSGSIGYNLGNDWQFVVEDNGAMDYEDISELVNAASGRCGLNDNVGLVYYNKNTPEGLVGAFIVRNNNAIFDYLLSGPQYPYMNLSRQRAKLDTIEDGYWLGMSDVVGGDYLKTLYGVSYENSMKLLQNDEFGGQWKPVYSTDYILYTASQFESLLDIDFNDPETMKEYHWGLYGYYKYNGRGLFFECNSRIQDTVRNYLSGKKLKQEYDSFTDMLGRTIEHCGILLDNVKYASLVLIKGGETLYDTKKYVVGDSLAIPFEQKNGSFPKIIAKTDKLTFGTQKAMAKPEFLINGTGLIDFPCYKVYGDTISNITKTNFSYNASKDRTRFDISVDGLFPDSLELSSSNTDWELIGKRTDYVVPSVFDRAKDYAENYRKHTTDVTNEARNEYPVVSGQELMTLSPSASFSDGTSFGNYDKQITLGSKYPMTPVGAVRFGFRTVFTVEVKGDKISEVFTITSSALKQQETVLVNYNRLNAKTRTQKLENKNAAEIGTVELQPYMYDATKVIVDCSLSDNELLKFTDSDVLITISDNTGAGKNVQSLLLSDVVLGKYDDFVYSTGLTYNSISKTYELVLYIAEYCDVGEFAGKGFNDSSVLVSFLVDEDIRKTYNIADYEFSVSYMTTLAPYIIQGDVYTKTPEEEQVLNSTVVPNNVSARVDYLYGSYANNSYNASADAIFTNGKPLYYCKASAFVPDEFTGQITDVDCYMTNSTKTRKYPVSFVSADEGISEYTVLVSGNSVGYEAVTDTTEAKANLRVYTFEQNLDVENMKGSSNIISNKLEISAHLNYSISAGETATNGMVKITN